MKKVLLSLVIVMVLVTGMVAAVAAELANMEIPFESLGYQGKWWTMDSRQMRVFLPDTWAPTEEGFVGDSDDEYIFAPADLSVILNIRVTNGDASDDHAELFQAIIDNLEEGGACNKIEAIKLNGNDVITYEIGDAEALGAIILAENNDSYMFESAPAAQDNAKLFALILSTFSKAQ